jgi:hypothetical protein
LPHDEIVQRARYTTWPKEYYLIEFDHANDMGGNGDGFESRINCLRWKHEFALQGDGELFRRRGDGEINGSYELRPWQKQLQSLFPKFPWV